MSDNRPPFPPGHEPEETGSRDEGAPILRIVETPPAEPTAARSSDWPGESWETAATVEGHASNSQSTDQQPAKLSPIEATPRTIDEHASNPQSTHQQPANPTPVPVPSRYPDRDAALRAATIPVPVEAIPATDVERPPRAKKPGPKPMTDEPTVRIEGQIYADQQTAGMATLARLKIENRATASADRRRLSINTLIRLGMTIVLDHADELHGRTEAELLDSLRTALQTDSEGIDE